MRVSLLGPLLGLVLVGVGLVSPGAAASSEIESPQGYNSGDTESSVGTSARSDARASRRLVLSTSDSQFDAGVDNQGWWSVKTPLRAQDRNDNYFVGLDNGLFRNFFTFDLSLIDKRVVGATLVLRHYLGEGNFTEKLLLSGVRTPAAVLNNNRGRDRRIYRDLGHGDRYGNFVLPTDTQNDGKNTFRMRLDGSAVTDINAARGEFFSLGGNLISLHSSKKEQFLFGGSGSAGRQDLVLFFR